MKLTIQKLTFMLAAAALLGLFAGSASAFSIGVAFHDSMNGGTASAAGSEDSAGGFQWWSAFQNKTPAPRNPYSSLLGNAGGQTGGWLGLDRSGGGSYDGDSDSVLSDMHDPHYRHIKLNFIKKFLFGWKIKLKIKRWLQDIHMPHPTDPPVVPVPAPLILLGSALAALFGFGRRRWAAAKG